MEKVQLQLPKSRSPLQSLAEDLNRLNSNPNLSDSERWMKFENIIHQYKSFSPKKGLDPTPETPDTFSILQSLPKKFQPRGQRLLEFLAALPSFGVDEKNQVVLAGTKLYGSHILDLIHFAVRDTKKTGEKPSGWQQFFDFLKQNNISHQYLSPLHHPPPRLTTRGVPRVQALSYQKGGVKDIFWSVSE